jgi:hypothetical protein
MIIQSTEEVIEQFEADKQKMAQYVLDLQENIRRMAGVNDAMYVRIQLLEGHDKVTIQ